MKEACVMVLFFLFIAAVIAFGMSMLMVEFEVLP